MALVLVADCGGTNSRLQLWKVEQGAKAVAGKRAPGALIHEQEYSNESYSKAGKTFVDIYRDFLRAAQPEGPTVVVSVASIAVAGPVEANAVNFTNNAWRIDGHALARETGIGRVTLMNDFVANGYGLLTLDEDAGHGARAGKEEQDVRILQKGSGSVGRAGRTLGAPIVCVGPGTGLGECFLTTHVGGDDVGSSNGWEHYTAFPSEGGHTEFAPRTPLEFELLQYLMKKFEQKHRVSVERVVSGRGLAHIFEFLCQHKEFSRRADPAVKKEFQAAGDLQGKVVATNAEKCPACAKAMEIFVAAFGSEAGSCALKYLPFGGLYLAGGLTPKNLHHLENVEHDTGIVTIEDAITRNIAGATPSDAAAAAPLRNRFLDAFRDKGRLSPQVHRVPVFAVMDQQLGQRGAHFVAVKLLDELESQAPASSSKAAASSSGPSSSVGLSVPLATASFVMGVLAAAAAFAFRSKK